MRVLLIGSLDAAKITTALHRAHILTDCVREPTYAQPGLAEGLFDVLLLSPPEGRAVDIVRSLRDDNIQTPLLVLTAHAAARDRIAALDAGADDFLTQPFLMSELLARVRALARRPPVLRPCLLTLGDLTFDVRQSVICCGSDAVRLSAREQQLLELFLANPRQILPRDMLLLKLWGYDAETAYNGVEVYVSLLRRKLRQAGSALRIRAARGVGYYLDLPE